jgi:site-specific DNA-methyltransferase (adenine-specific)
MSLPKPYYSENGIVIYNADCREILPHLEPVDLVLTDPPYGIARVWKGGFGHGWGQARVQAVVRNEWDQKAPSSAVLETIAAKATKAIIWGGNYFDLEPSRGWLVWNKPERGFSLAEAELAWTNVDAVIRVYDCNRSDPGREHPTQKPLDLMKWCIAWSKCTGTILDPFMGSGTTLRAAKDLGRKCIGIEIEEKYCEIAVKRLAQEVLAL